MIFAKAFLKLVSSNRSHKEIVDRIIDVAERKRDVEGMFRGEYMFWLIRWLIWEVRNGGVSQYVCNSTGSDLPALIEAVSAIGQSELEKALKKTRSAFSESFPHERTARVEAWNIAVSNGVVDDDEITNQIIQNSRDSYKAMVDFAKNNPELFDAKY